jgi:hypothetical protein
MSHVFTSRSVLTCGPGAGACPGPDLPRGPSHSPLFAFRAPWRLVVRLRRHLAAFHLLRAAASQTDKRDRRTEAQKGRHPTSSCHAASAAPVFRFGAAPTVSVLLFPSYFLPWSRQRPCSALALLLVQSRLRRPFGFPFYCFRSTVSVLLFRSYCFRPTASVLMFLSYCFCRTVSPALSNPKKAFVMPTAKCGHTVAPSLSLPPVRLSIRLSVCLSFGHDAHLEVQPCMGFHEPVT